MSVYVPSKVSVPMWQISADLPTSPYLRYVALTAIAALGPRRAPLWLSWSLGMPPLAWTRAGGAGCARGAPTPGVRCDAVPPGRSSPAVPRTLNWAFSTAISALSFGTLQACFTRGRGFTPSPRTPAARPAATGGVAGAAARVVEGSSSCIPWTCTADLRPLRRRDAPLRRPNARPSSPLAPPSIERRGPASSSKPT